MTSARRNAMPSLRPKQKGKAERGMSITKLLSVPVGDISVTNCGKVSRQSVTKTPCPLSPCPFV